MESVCRVRPRDVPEAELSGVQELLFNLQNTAGQLIAASTSVRSDMLRRDSYTSEIVLHSESENSAAIFVANHDISPGTLIFTDVPRIVFPSCNFRTEEFSCKEIGIRGGVAPTAWLCFGCMKSVGQIYPHWCSKCGVPLCGPSCEEYGIWHQEECKIFQAMNVPIRRFLELGWVYLDVAISRVLLLLKKCEMFAGEFNEISSNSRVVKFVQTSTRHRDFLENLSRKTMPLALGLANGSRMDIITIHAVLGSLGHSIKPRRDVALLLPVLASFQHGCYSNTELSINTETFQIEIRAAAEIKKHDAVIVDFLQEPLLSTPYRRNLIENLWFISCSCSRCLDPTEFGTHCGSAALWDEEESEYEETEDKKAPGNEMVQALQTHLVPTSNSNSGLNVKRNAKAVTERKAYQDLFGREREAMKIIQDIQYKRTPYKPHQYLKVKAKLEKAYHVHESHHIMLRLVEITLNLMDKADNERAELTAADNALMDEETTVNLYSSLTRQMGAFLDVVSPPAARIRAYTMYNLAKAQGQYLEFRAQDSCKARYAGMLKNALERLPLLIQAWKHLILFQFPADSELICKIALDFINLNPLDYMDELKELQEGRRSNGRKGITGVTLLAENEALQASDGEPSSDSEAGGTFASSDETDKATDPETEVKGEPIPKIKLSGDRGTILLTTPKKNKLKEALIRRQVEQRRLCQQQLSKQLEYASKHGGEVQFNLPGTNYRRNIAKKKEAAAVASELESDADRKDSGSTETESQDKSMNNPIPVHHNSFKNSNRFRKPRGHRMREYYTTGTGFPPPFPNLHSGIAPLQMAAPFDMEHWTTGYNVSNPPFGFYQPISNPARHINITVHPRPFSQQSYGPFCNTASSGQHYNPHTAQVVPFQDHFFQQYVLTNTLAVGLACTENNDASAKHSQSIPNPN